MKSLTIDDLKEVDGIYYREFTGKLKSKFEVCSFKNGLKHGLWIIRWENEKLRFECNYKNNLQEGNSIYYNKDGEKKYEGNINAEINFKDSTKLTSNEINNLMEGLESGITDFEDNRSAYEEVSFESRIDAQELVSDLSFELTKKLKIINDNNKSIYFDKFTGEINGREKGTFKKGKKNGPWIYYLDDGQISSKGNYYNGKKDGYWISYRDNNIIPSYDGQISSKGNYKNGKKEGPWVSYAEQDGQLKSIGNYNNGLKDGTWFELSYIWKNSKQLTKIMTASIYKEIEVTNHMYKAEYKNGELVGTSLSYEDGKIRNISNYKKGGWRHGSLVRYYENGQIENKQNWKNNIKEGLEYQYFENGSLYFKGMFKNGKQNGYSYYYYEDGTLDKQTSGTYKDGVKIGD